MTYKETLLFIGKCLTINKNKSNKKAIENKLRNTNIDWDSILKLSTKHYVLPALYCNLKRAQLLYSLPKDLVDYMIYITGLNRTRNLKIIKQAKAINSLLLANNITPVFLKGTANLLDGLYIDIAERMVGDIDFIIDKKSADIALKILFENNYTYSEKIPKQFGYIKHYPRLIRSGEIGAIEVHLELTLKKFSSIFNYQVVKSQLRKKDAFTFLSYQHQTAHTIINKQLNDDGYIHQNIALRNYYDLFLLSHKTNTLKSIELFPKIFKQLNSFLSIASIVFPNTQSIHFKKNKHAIHYQKTTLKLLNTPKKHLQRNRRLKLFSTFMIRINLLSKAFYSKSHCIYVLQKLSNLKWYQRVLFNQ